MYVKWTEVERRKGVIVQTASSVAPSGHINSVQAHHQRLQKTNQHMQYGKRGMWCRLLSVSTASLVDPHGRTLVSVWLEETGDLLL